MRYFGISDRERKEGLFYTKQDRLRRRLTKQLEDNTKERVSLDRQYAANEARVFEVEFESS